MAQSAAHPVYQDFDPFSEWTRDEGSATLTVTLPGFRKDQLIVQVTSTPVLRIKGERQIGQNIWRRFTKEFPIPLDCDANEVTAKFEDGLLNVRFPKLITPAAEPQEETTNPPPEEAPTPPPQPTAEAPAQEVDQQKPPPQKENKEAESKTEAAAPEKVAQKKVGLPETAEGATPEAREKQGAKVTQRLKTRVLDFTISLRPTRDEDVNQGINGGLVTGLKRTKVLMNVIVAILMVVVLGLYVKNAFRSSHGEESKFQEF